MSENLKSAKEKLRSGRYTLVMYDGSEMISSEKRGIAPLVELYRSGRDFSAFSAADKVVGRAAAFMYVLLGISSVYACCISKPAKAVLESAGISADFEKLVDRIASRDGKGLCPMETAVMDIDEPADAYKAILEKQTELSAEQNRTSR